MFFRALKWMILAPLMVAVIVPSGALLWASHTTNGRIVALACLAFGLCIGLAGLFRRKPARWWWCAALGLGGAGLILSGFALIHAPDGRAAESARVQHRYAGGSWHFQRYALGNIVPEIDQFRMGFSVVSCIDPLFDRRQAKALGRWTTTIYDELEADADFHALGSVMPNADLRGEVFEHGHYFLYIPTRLDRKSAQPALVFLHGSGGNFKAYTWLLAKVADRLGCVVIVPSFGMGNWSEPESTRVVMNAIEDAGRVVKIDPRRRHLVGLSNGGLGVSQIAVSAGSEFRSLVFLSPVFDQREIESVGFGKQWSGRPVLVITGKADDRVSFEYVGANVRTMQDAGAKVTLEAVDAADHFLFFSHEALVLARLEAWLKEQEAQD
jgi:pimeloyl-ACP methyl ester carboxylesterase